MGQAIVVVVYGGILGFLALVFGLFFFVLVRAFRKSKAAHEAVTAWCRTAQLASTEMMPGVPARMSFQAAPGVTYRVWIDCEVEHAERQFRLAACLRVGDALILDQTYDVREDSEDGFSGVPFHMSVTGFVGPEGVFLRRALVFSVESGGPATLDLRFDPAGSLPIARMHARVTGGEPPG